MTETLANRRVFRSKVDAIRPTYGFEDVSLAPGTDTVEVTNLVFTGLLGACVMYTSDKSLRNLDAAISSLLSYLQGLDRKGKGAARG